MKAKYIIQTSKEINIRLKTFTDDKLKYQKILHNNDLI